MTDPVDALNVRRHTRVVVVAVVNDAANAEVRAW